MKQVILIMLIGVGLVLAGPISPLSGPSDLSGWPAWLADRQTGEAWAQTAGQRLIKEFEAPFLSLPLRGFFYPPAVETTNKAMVKVWESGDGQRNSTIEYKFRGLAPHNQHSLWFVNLFMLTRQGAFPGAAPPSPQGNPYLGWAAGTAGFGFDVNGDGILTCGEGTKGFDPVITTRAPSPPGDMDGEAVGTGQWQSLDWDQNSFCTNEWGHANPIIRLPYDITTTNVPAEGPPIFQTEVVTDHFDGVVRKQRHVVNGGDYLRIYDEDPASPRFGFQKVDNFGRPILFTFRTMPYVVCAHYEGGVGFTHGRHPANGPDDGPTSTALGSDHECLMAAMPTTQARTEQDD